MKPLTKGSNRERYSQEQGEKWKFLSNPSHRKPWRMKTQYTCFLQGHAHSIPLQGGVRIPPCSTQTALSSVPYGTAADNQAPCGTGTLLVSSSSHGQTTSRHGTAHWWDTSHVFIGEFIIKDHVCGKQLVPSQFPSRFWPPAFDQKRNNVHVSSGHWAYYFAYISHSHIHVTKSIHLEDALLRCKSASPNGIWAPWLPVSNCIFEADVLLYRKKKRPLPQKPHFVSDCPALSPTFPAIPNLRATTEAVLPQPGKPLVKLSNTMMRDLLFLAKQQLLFTF